MTPNFKNGLTLAAIAFAATSALSTTAFARDQIRAVGSSTVYPFTTAVAEHFGKASGKTPVVESTGTGGGLKLFCAGIGEATPDIANASRPMKKAEFEDCQKNGVTDIVEIKFGLDGIVIAHSKSSPDFSLQQEELFLALAKEIHDENLKFIPNPHKVWQDIDPLLPATKIEVLGPPPTSGTRDAFLELIMEKGAKGFGALRELKDADEKNGTKDYEKVWKSLREDGAYIDAGENDNLIVQKLEGNPDAVGIFGFSFLEENKSKIKSVQVGGVEATYEDIANGKYPGSRALFIYVKKAHVALIPGMKEFLAEYVSDKTIGEDGYLVGKGMISMPKEDIEKAAKAAAELTPMAAPEK
ncbi:phosphate ABC transporter substrate-binding protein [Hyphomicrobium sp. xq]|uniref:Phosphate ABC transporter substrate-binding protein n=1 Tax=Hyphomicrobium album TaxID=2665159 RepID=A0A6I3KFJ5_9HYPH|nr:PstS family phosphate ABC transporter substrate-binding protein [Hyphomicrobium album]MTD93308.1 phosphate ABC transporter substrate-binding protein [Hyphomicrobium album]